MMKRSADQADVSSVIAEFKAMDETLDKVRLLTSHQL